MKIPRNDIIGEIVDSARKTLTLLEEEKDVDFGEKPSLVGSEGIFDSIGLVTFIVELEQGMEKRFGVRVSLADERAIAQEVTPFSSITTLAAYIEKLLLEN